jgi:hypothetical protein
MPIKKRIAWNKGKSLSPEHKRKIKESCLRSKHKNKYDGLDIPLIKEIFSNPPDKDVIIQEDKPLHIIVTIRLKR